MTNDHSGGFTEGWSSTGLSWAWGNTKMPRHENKLEFRQVKVFLQLGLQIQRVHRKGKSVKITPGAAY